MKLRLEQLTQHLQKNLAPLYLISGTEYLLVSEAHQQIQQAAAKKGYVKQPMIEADQHFNWSTFYQNMLQVSLFQTQSFMPLHFTNKLSASGIHYLEKYALAPSANHILLILIDKLDAAMQKTAWFKALDKQGIIIQIWPLEPAQLPQWLTQRLAQANLSVDADALQFLVDYVANNLLAAAQEIVKLQLIYGSGRLSLEQVSSVIADNAQFDMFNLVDAALSGDSKRTARICQQLQETQHEVVLVLWSIVREIRQLAALRQQVDTGQSIATVLQNSNLWPKRKPLIKTALEKHSMFSIYNLLHTAAHIDSVIKGINPGNAWSEILLLSLQLAGTPLFPATVTNLS